MIIALQYLAALFMWAAFQPVGSWPLAFVAVLCWMPAIATQRSLGRGFYLHTYLASAIAWLALLQGIRLAYWPLYAGWIALSLYIAVYIPVFIGVSRFLVHRWRWPITIAASLTWVGCELLRCYIMTGFGGCLLSHALAEQPLLIQLASHIGPHGVSGLIILTGAAIFLWLAPTSKVRKLLEGPVQTGDGSTDELDTAEPVEIDTNPRRRLANMRSQRFSATIASVAVFVFFGVGYWEFQAGQELEQDAEPLLKVALIQEVAETRFEYNPARAHGSWTRYADLTSRTGKDHPDLDLVVWPESVYTPESPFFDWDGGRLPESFAKYAGDPQTVYQDSKYFHELSRRKLRDMQFIAAGGDREFYSKLNREEVEPEDAQVPALLMGISLWQLRDNKFERYNSAVFQPKDNSEAMFYSKRYLVMFGEYIPFAYGAEKIYDALGMAELAVGKRWEVFEVDGVQIAPSICFEDMLPQAIQSQVATLTANNSSPDILVNVTNDGWFRGSSMLDHHLACAVFSAVENRRPMLVAANTGISTWVSGNGEIKARGPRMAADAIIALPTLDSRWGLWQTVGDWPARVCGLLVVVALMLLYVESVREKARSKSVKAIDA